MTNWSALAISLGITIALSSTLYKSSGNFTKDDASCYISTHSLFRSPILKHFQTRKSLCDDSSSKSLSLDDANRLMAKKLSIFRAKCADQGNYLSSGVFSKDPHGNRYFEMPLPTKAGSNLENDLKRVIDEWAPALSGQNLPENLLKQLVSKREVISSDHKSSILLRTNEQSKESYLLLFKDYDFSESDVDYLSKGYIAVFNKSADANCETKNSKKLDPLTRKNSNQTKAIADLRSLGLTVYEDDDEKPTLSWEHLAGYDHVKRDIEESIVHPMSHPDVFEGIAKQTRENYELHSSLPKAILFEGPPGTGKTLTARVIASRCGRPLIHLPVENIVSKWYGEAEQNLRKIFDACDDLEGGAILFIDEVDALASSRDGHSQMHEASRRILSVILQRIEGFSSQGKTLLICATNRKKDLDAAMISRFDINIRFDLPDLVTRTAIFARYAKQLNQSGKSQLAEASNGMSCRDIRDICIHAERRWAGKMIRGEAGGVADKQEQLPPPLEEYLECLYTRRTTLSGASGQSTQMPSPYGDGSIQA